MGGSGTISQSGVDTTVSQSTSRMAIDWRSFDVQTNERVQFIQPGRDALALNRVLSNSPSEIFGRIDANGRVLIVNPNGIFVGASATINVGGLIASGLDIDPDRFMNGDFYFSGVAGEAGFVINHGLIEAATGGEVVLLGKTVENTGLVQANLGQVTLASGSEAVLTFDSEGLVGVQVTREVLENQLGLDAQIANSGRIEAEGGEILLTAQAGRDLFSQAVNNSGIVTAAGFQMDGGVVRLVAKGEVINSGHIDASSTGNGNGGLIDISAEIITHTGVATANAEVGDGGEILFQSGGTTILKDGATVSADASIVGHGGSVHVLGDRVGLFGTAQVSAKGAAGGGEVLIGGDRQGGNPDIQNASAVYVDKDSIVDTSATGHGNGGKLIVYADQSARVYGELKSTGGESGGDGGFIETSGKQYFDIRTVPDVSAHSGSSGAWLIDPYDLEIVSGSDNNITPVTDPNSSPQSWLPEGDGATLSVQSILDFFGDNIGGSLTITTQGTGGAGNGDITVRSDIGLQATPLQATATPTAELVLDAAGDIVVNGKIYDDGGGSNNEFLDIELDASGSVYINRLIETSGGDFTAVAGDSVVFGGAVDSNGDFSSSNGVVNVGLIDVSGVDRQNSNAVRNGLITISAGEALDLVAIDGNGLPYGAPTLFTGGDDGTGSGNVSLTASNLSGISANAINLGWIDMTGAGGDGSLSIEASGNVVQAAGTQIDAGAVTIVANNVATVTPADTYYSVTLDSANNDFTGVVSIESAGDTRVVDSNDIELGYSNVVGDLVVSSGGSVSQSAITGDDSLNVSSLAAFDAAGSISLVADTAGGGDLGNDFNEFVVTGGTDVNVSDMSGIVLGATDVTVGAFSHSGALDVTAGGVISQVDALVGDSSGVAASFTTTGTGLSGYAVDLNLSGNDFTTLAVNTASGDARILDNGDLTLEASVLSGNLELDVTNTSSNTIDQADAVSVTGVAAIASNGNVALNDAGNDFHEVVVLSGVNVDLADANDIILGTGDVAFGEFSHSGGLTVTAGDSIDQLDTLNGTGAGVAAGFSITNTGLSGDVIQLSDNANDFSTLGISTVSGSANIVDANGVTLADSNVAGDLTLQAGGAVDQNTGGSGAGVTVAGLTTINGSDPVATTVSLGDTDNDFNRFVTQGIGTVTVADTNDIVLGAAAYDKLSYSRGLTVIAAGSIAQESALEVGDATVGTKITQLTARDIALDDAANDFDVLNLDVTESAGGAADGQATIVDRNHVYLSGSSTVRGDLDLFSGSATESGAILQTAPGDVLTVTGDARFQRMGTDPGVAVSVINLQGSGNDLNRVMLVSDYGSVYVNDANDIAIGETSVTGDLRVTAAGDIASDLAGQTGGVVVNGAFRAEAGFGADFVNTNGTYLVDFTDGSNNFNQFVARGSDIHVADVDDIVLGTTSSTAGITAFELESNPTIDVQAGGAVTQVDALSGAGLSGSFSSTQSGAAGVDVISLVQPANNFTELQLYTTSGNARVYETDTVALGNTDVAGNLILLTSGDVTQVSGSTIIVDGTLLLDQDPAGGSPARLITLDEQPNDFNLVALAGSGATLYDANALRLTSSSITGDLTLWSQGDVSQVQGSTVRVGGEADVRAADFGGGGGATYDVALAEPTNDFHTISAIGYDISIADANFIDDLSASAENDLFIRVGDDLDVSSLGSAQRNLTYVSDGNLTINSDLSADNITLIADADSQSGGTLTIVDGADVTATGSGAASSVHIYGSDISIGATAAVGAEGDVYIGSYTPYGGLDQATDIYGDVYVVPIGYAGAVSGASLELSELGQLLPGSSGSVHVIGENVYFVGGATPVNYAVDTSLAVDAQSGIGIQNNVDISLINGDLALNGELSGGGLGINVDAGSADLSGVRRDGSASLQVLDITANGSVSLGEVSATIISINSTNGSISGVGGLTNLAGASSALQAATGIGPLQTNLDVMRADNTGSGDIIIADQSSLTVRQAVNAGGDIDLSANGDLVLQKEPDATTNPDYRIYAPNGDVDLTAVSGTIYATGTTSSAYPDIEIGPSSTLTFSGDQLGLGRGVGIRHNDGAVRILTTFYLEPIWYPAPPANFTNNATLRAALSDTKSVVSAESQSEVDELADLDPALFTALRNYDYDDLAVRLPLDQYEDERYAEAVGQ